MAEINVTRRGPTVWPWILGLILLALLIWGLTELLGDSDPEIVPDPPRTAETRSP